MVQVSSGLVVLLCCPLILLRFDHRDHFAPRCIFLTGSLSLCLSLFNGWIYVTTGEEGGGCKGQSGGSTLRVSCRYQTRLGAPVLQKFLSGSLTLATSDRACYETVTTSLRWEGYVRRRHDRDWSTRTPARSSDGSLSLSSSSSSSRGQNKRKIFHHSGGKYRCQWENIVRERVGIIDAGTRRLYSDSERPTIWAPVSI